MTSKGNLTTITDALGNSMTLAYNPEGQPVSITDALGNVAQLTYDLGIRSGMTDPLGANCHAVHRQRGPADHPDRSLWATPQRMHMTPTIA